MPTLNFTHFSGAVSRYSGYTLEQTDGMLYLIPKSLAVRRYDPFKDVDGLLLDVVQAGAMVADCAPFLNYCLAHKILPLQDVDFWRHGDFFTTHHQEAQPNAAKLLSG